jgi:Transposase IS116/IS110/IS902 family
MHGVAVCRWGTGRGRDRRASGRAGRYRRGPGPQAARQDRTDARHLRQLLAEGRLPECWIPAARILECRALLETYHDLRREHTAWLQRIHAVFFHQGAPALGEGALRGARGLAAVRAAAAAHLSPAGQVQVAVAVEMMTVLEDRLHELRHRLLDAAGQMAGAKVLAERIYGVGPLTALALTCWLGGKDRFSSARKAVRFAGLDITVYSSDGKRSPGRLSRQGPPVLAGRPTRPARRTPAPRPPTTPTTPPSGTARTASAPRCRRPARSSGRPATSWPSSAATRSPPPEPSGDRSRGTPGRRRAPQPNSPMGNNRGQLPSARCQPMPAPPAGPPGRPD